MDIKKVKELVIYSLKLQIRAKDQELLTAEQKVIRLRIELRELQDSLDTLERS